MKLFKLLLTTLIFSPLFSARTTAAIDIEIDPATYAFKGDSLHIKYTSDSAPQWRWGIGTYRMEMPDALVDFNEKNKNQNWNVEIKRAYGLFAEYYFDASQKGWFLGGQISQQEYRIEKPTTNAQVFTNGLLMMNIGYKWNIQDSGFYVLPWAGIGYTKTLGNKSERIASGFDVNPITAFMTVHIGYEF